MDIKLECTHYLSNSCTWVSKYDDFVVTRINCAIKITVPSTSDSEEFMDIAVGSIYAYRINLGFDHDTLFNVTDSFDQELTDLIDYFVLGQDEEVDSIHQLIDYSEYLYHVYSVYIEPVYRVKSLGLKAVALFLEAFAKENIVSCHPYPIEKLPSQYSLEKQKYLLKKYWSKLGLTHYNEKCNLLWEPEWSLPGWLSELLW